jgi:hypothetical protein
LYVIYVIIYYTQLYYIYNYRILKITLEKYCDPDGIESLITIHKIV